MNSSDNPVQGTQVARFACDYCRQKKFRELPKCSACLPWPGPCDYSRDRLKSAPTQSQPSSVPTQGQPGTQGNEPTPQLAVTRIDLTVESRLCSIEHKLDRLTLLVEKAVLRAASEKESESDAQTPSRANQASSQTDSRVPKLFIGESHSFSFVREATGNLRSTPGIPGPSSQQETDAQSELQFLSSSLTTATVEPGHNLHISGFHVPSRAIGYKLIGKHAPKGEPFFVTPSEELLKQIVFNPDKVSQKAWLVYFNYIMLAQVSPEKQDHGEEAARFRQNMRIALNDSRIFLEPRQVNVQALALLAVHGEDYASPNLSWMLVGHACRQAEALGLHLLAPRDIESYQRSLSMFWLLFVLDKSCALAFGRSPFLPMKLYQDVPLPDFSYLLKFQPHLDSDFSSAPPAARPSEFGAHFFIRGIELAKIMGLVVDMLAPGSPPPLRETIKLQLEEWANQTKK
ncbi:Fungal specific transcription factor domain-containing protein, partial [Colletotrichum scovillei]